MKGHLASGYHVTWPDLPVWERWKRLEDEEGQASRALWSMPKPVAPWEFGKRN